MPRKQNKRKSRKTSRVAIQSNPVKISGKGGFLSDILKPLGSALLKPIGEIAKPMLKAIGVGDYKIKANTLWNTNSTSVPEFSDNVNLRIKRKEFVADIHGSADFTMNRYVVNPRNSEIFPWLSTVSDAFQQWRLHGCLLVFVPTTADYSSTSALGTLSIGTQYDVKEEDPESMSSLLQLQYSSSGKPSEQLVHPFECKADLTVIKQMYTSSEEVDGSDRFADFAHTYVATEGTPTGVIGQLWITYDVELTKPSPKAISAVGGQVQLMGSSEFTGSGSYYNVNMPELVASYDTLGTKVLKAADGAYGAYYINLARSGRFFVTYIRLLGGTTGGPLTAQDLTITLGSDIELTHLLPCYTGGTIGGTTIYNSGKSFYGVTSQVVTIPSGKGRSSDPTTSVYHLKMKDGAGVGSDVTAGTNNVNIIITPLGHDSMMIKRAVHNHFKNAMLKIYDFQTKSSTTGLLLKQARITGKHYRHTPPPSPTAEQKTSGWFSV